LIVYYRGSPGCRFQRFSYFTKYCPEAELYAIEFYGEGDLCRAVIKPENPLHAEDIWDAGRKLGVREMDDKTRQRSRILDEAVKKGYDSILMNSWLVLLDPDIVKSINKIDKCPVVREDGQK